MIQIQDKSKCSGCYACALICPKKCICLVTDEEGFLYPKIDRSLCLECNLCEQVCPILNPIYKSQVDIPDVYAVKNNDEDTRAHSSSGGVFTALAEYILEQGGIVFGAAFASDWSVVHIAVDCKEDLWKLRGAKYLQSVIGNVYCEAKAALQNGQLVLFTGTPCQIGGLKAFLGKEYSNLYTQDLICHGVPSAMVWHEYLRYLNKKYEADISYIFFRDKSKSWKKYSVVVRFVGGRELEEPFTENLYMRAFLHNLSLRPSCHNCRFKGIDRVSDITLADFWGIENVSPQMDDDKGTSLVMVYSTQGGKLLDAVTEKLLVQKADLQAAIYENRSAVYSSPQAKERAVFFSRLSALSFDKNVKKATTPHLFVRIKSILRRAVKKIKRIICRK